jgi:ABC-type uncharacterized transport system substrate-binding protein
MLISSISRHIAGIVAPPPAVNVIGQRLFLQRSSVLSILSQMIILFMPSSTSPAACEASGLLSNGPEAADQYRRAAAYVDRILKGETPSNLPVQGATKFEFVINLKTAKALGLEVPDRLLAVADEVVE